jgi:hypothetical protein
MVAVVRCGGRDNYRLSHWSCHRMPQIRGPISGAGRMGPGAVGPVATMRTIAEETGTTSLVATKMKMTKEVREACRLLLISDSMGGDGDLRVCE